MPETLTQALAQLGECADLHEIDITIRGGSVWCSLADCHYRSLGYARKEAFDYDGELADTIAAAITTALRSAKEKR